MKEIKKIDKFLIKITTVEQQKKTENKIEQLYVQNKETAKSNGKIREEVNEQKEIVEIKTQEIKRLEKEIQKAKAEIQKADVERLDIAAKLDLKKMELEDCKKSIDSKVASAKGGFTKEINKLKVQLEEKDTKIAELEKEIKDLTDRNNVQAEKISKLTSEQKHTIEEFKNDGLSKPAKKALSNVIKKKNEEKGKMLVQAEKELEKAVDNLVDNLTISADKLTAVITSEPVVVASKQEEKVVSASPVQNKLNIKNKKNKKKRNKR